VIVAGYAQKLHPDLISSNSATHVRTYASKNQAIWDMFLHAPEPLDRTVFTAPALLFRDDFSGANTKSPAISR
jgi:hypothetical protein